MKRFFKIICIICFIFVLSGCKEKIHTKIPKEVYIYFKDEDINVYEKYFLSDLIKDTNVSIMDLDIDTNDVGSRTLRYYFYYNEKKYVTEHEYYVSDNEAPKIFGSSNKTVLVNYKKDLCNLVTYGDNYDKEPVCYVTGDYDLDTVGNYKVTINVVDTSGNESTFDINLNVVSYIKEEKPKTATKIAFSDVYKKYKNNDNELGIDVSKWQQDIDFNEVKNAGASFVMMRIGVKLNSNEEPSIDSYYLENIKKAKEAGLKVGVYLYSKALTKEEAMNEANWVLTTLNGESLDLGVAFDWEIWSNWNSYHLSFHDLNEIAHGFIDTINYAGYDSLLYGSKFYLENFWDKTYPNVWLAHYVTNTTYEGYKIWQFTSNGTIDGIAGAVDLDVLINN